MADEQKDMDLGQVAAGEVSSVEGYKFQPIKGYPMLNWRGKRPFTSTQFYPAQLKETYGEEVTTREVPCRTLDEIVASHGCERVDLMKIDVEGFEYQAFLGAREMLKKHRPTIIMEWLGGFYRAREETGRALWKLLTEELGYDLRLIDGNATTRATTFDELKEIQHSDLLAEPKR